MSAYLKIISPEKVQDTFDQLDAVVQDVVAKGASKEGAYGNKAEKLKLKRQLETEVELKESEALMDIRGEGKEAHVIMGDQKVSLTNDKLRDAYRKNASRAERQRLAEVEADLAKLEIHQYQANDSWSTAVEAAGVVKAKANLQASLLNFVSKNS
ncbi:hypothetical protein [Sutcliffiella horikoshii]|uniref:hypothetical protein n=1 Tax=Sutcliffiella horikoshii TaxID=79883 RepID=UPI0021CCD02E|nr:hypothetical protein [Sutcliffiella horikoshii]